MTNGDWALLAFPSWSYLRAIITNLPGLFPLDLKQPISAMESLLATNSATNWKELANVCVGMRILQDPDYLWFSTFYCGSYTAFGQRWDWEKFWLFAQGRCAERLTPVDALKILQEAEELQAKRRLQTNFFDGESWTRLSERCRRSLINAERIWFSTEIGRYEAALNDIKIAVEELLHGLFWIPMTSRSAQFPGRDLINEKEKELTDRGHSPSIADYRWLCQRTFFRDYLSTSGKFTAQDLDFLTKVLPESLSNLITYRNAAEHSNTVDRDTTKKLYREFFGIRQVGVLPKLAEMNALFQPRSRW